MYNNADIKIFTKNGMLIPLLIFIESDKILSKSQSEFIEIIY